MCLRDVLELLCSFRDPADTGGAFCGRSLLLTLKAFLSSAVKAESGTGLNFGVEFVDLVLLWVVANGSFSEPACRLDVSG